MRGARGAALARAAGALALACALACAAAAAMLAGPSLVAAWRAQDFSAFHSGPGEPEGGLGIDWAALAASNPAAVGWVRVPGTGVDCPIVQAPGDDPEFYLYHALDGGGDAQGCPYLDASCAGEGLEGAASLVFGHSLLSGAMFSDLQYMSDPSYAEEHAEIWLATPAWERRLRVCCVEVLDADVEEKTVGIEDGKGAAAELARAASRAAVVMDPPREPGRIWRFATCSYQSDNSRTLVYAVEDGG